ncbi:MAG TPA: MIP/aquaporin family protein [Pyrinomonadaceae bacterium]|nr:MIP/aquaporin family protein [Pyrinomonadaceae bacterium]
MVATAMLLAAVVGSGIMAERLAGGNVAIALLANTIATGAALVTLILTFGPVSGAHMNPVVTLSFLTRENLRESIMYVFAQVGGAVAGAMTANIMFSLPPVSLSHHERAGAAQLFSEVVATFGLVLVIQLCAKFQPRMIAFAVGAYITAAYWFTASTSFANPAVTLARSLSDTFTGIRPIDVPAFVLAQLVGGAIAVLLARWLIPNSLKVASND